MNRVFFSSVGPYRCKSIPTILPGIFRAGQCDAFFGQIYLRGLDPNWIINYKEGWNCDNENLRCFRRFLTFLLLVISVTSSLSFAVINMR